MGLNQTGFTSSDESDDEGRLGTHNFTSEELLFQMCQELIKIRVCLQAISGLDLEDYKHDY